MPSAIIVAIRPKSNFVIETLQIHISIHKLKWPIVQIAVLLSHNSRIFQRVSRKYFEQICISGFQGIHEFMLPRNWLIKQLQQVSKVFIRRIRSSHQSKGRKYIESRNSYMYILNKIYGQVSDKIHSLFCFEIGKNNKRIGSWWVNNLGTSCIEKWWLMIELLGLRSQGTCIHLTICRCAFFNTYFVTDHCEFLDS